MAPVLGLAVALAVCLPARAGCALFDMDEAGHAGDTLELGDGRIASRFAGTGTGGGAWPDRFCADVDFNLDGMGYARYERREHGRSWSETLAVSPDRALFGGVETWMTGSRRLLDNGHSETRLSQRAAIDGVEVAGSWASTPVEDRYAVSLAEDWISGPGLSLSARHGLRMVHARAGGELRIADMTAGFEAAYQGWRLGVVRSGPAPVGRIGAYEVTLAYPEQDAMIYPEASGVRAEWIEGEAGPVSTWMEWSVLDTAIGVEAASADHRDWTVGLGWRFPAPLIHDLEISTSVNLDPVGRSERQVTLAGTFTW